MTLVMLQIKVLKAQGLPAADLCGTSDPYCIIKCDKVKKKTSVIKKTLEPTWDECFTFPVSMSAKKITIECYDRDTFKFDDPLGKTEMELVALEQEPKYYNEPRWYQLTPMRKSVNPKRCGEIQLSFCIISRECEHMPSVDTDATGESVSDTASTPSPKSSESESEPLSLSSDLLAAGLSLHDDGLDSEDDDTSDEEHRQSSKGAATKSFHHGRSESACVNESSGKKVFSLKKSFRLKAPSSFKLIKSSTSSGKASKSSSSSGKSGKSFRMRIPKPKSKQLSCTGDEINLEPLTEEREDDDVAGETLPQTTESKDSEDLLPADHKNKKRESLKALGLITYDDDCRAHQRSASGSTVNSDVGRLPALVFEKYDVDANGVIDRNEFHDMILDLGYYFEAQELLDAFAIVDNDGDGFISINEFASFWRRDDRFRFLRLDEDRRQKVKQLSEFFAYFDRLKRGMLDCDEFIAMHQAMVISGYTSLGDSKECMNALDLNKDGFVHFNELLAYAVQRGLLDTTQVA